MVEIILALWFANLPPGETVELKLPSIEFCMLVATASVGRVHPELGELLRADCIEVEPASAAPGKNKPL